MESFLERLENDYLPKAHDNFRLGKEKYMELLAKQEFINIDFDTLLRIGEDDLERNYQSIKEIIAKSEEE